MDPGKWTVRKQPDSIEFQQEVNGPSGYAYVYRKTIRLSPGKPGMILEHSLKNTGRQVIETPVYNHNFLVMDDQPSGPDFVIKVPFEIQPARDRLGVLEVRGKEVVFARELVEDERAMITVAGFSGDRRDYDIRVENRKTGAGVRITADRPLARFVVWSVRPTRCPSPSSTCASSRARSLPGGFPTSSTLHRSSCSLAPIPEQVNPGSNHGWLAAVWLKEGCPWSNG